MDRWSFLCARITVLAATLWSPQERPWSARGWGRDCGRADGHRGRNCALIGRCGGYSCNFSQKSYLKASSGMGGIPTELLTSAESSRPRPRSRRGAAGREVAARRLRPGAAPHRNAAEQRGRRPRAGPRPSGRDRPRRVAWAPPPASRPPPAAGRCADGSVAGGRCEGRGTRPARPRAFSLSGLRSPVLALSAGARPRPVTRSRAGRGARRRRNISPRRGRFLT